MAAINRPIKGLVFLNSAVQERFGSLPIFKDPRHWWDTQTSGIATSRHDATCPGLCAQQIGSFQHSAALGGGTDT